ncbi:MAG TPA: hypothetical protein VF477_02300 [Mycobacterium sp.]
MKARRIAACVLAAGALLVGCQSTVDGNPKASTGSPTEPNFPTSRPSRSSTPPTSSTPSSSSTPTAAPGPGDVLAPQNGYVFIETKSGKTRCQINTEEVGCESTFANAPVVGGTPANGVRLTADGKVEWIVGNLGDIPTVTLDYRTYSAEGWTIAAGEDGTRFTNDGTGHGMFINTDGVQVF